MAREVYVERLIRADLERLWSLTQDPGTHQRWDARFGSIEYLPCKHPEQPQRLRYSTRVLPGVMVAGSGVSVGDLTRPDGSRTSVLRFASTHPLSPIRSGSGYWRYLPTEEGIRFLTGYDYTPRFGRLVDRLFRPLMGWATAWSFDRLRLWAERGVSPELALRCALLDLGVRVAAVAVATIVDPPAGAVTAAVALGVRPSPYTPAARHCLRRRRLSRPVRGVAR